jgi:hypothetical protein
VLPTLAHLKNPSPKTVMFHPLQENLMRGESEVFTEYRKALAVRINCSSLAMIRDLLVLAGSASLHNKLNPDQSEVLSLLKGVSNKTIEAWDKIIDNIPEGQLFRSAVKFYMKPAGKIGDKAYTRLGVVTFPLYEAICKKDEKVFGVDPAGKHREIIKKAFEYIFPQLDVAHQYSRGSNSQVAPMFDAMIRSFSAVCQAYNNVCMMFKDLKIPELFEDTVCFSSDWWDEMQNLDALLVEVRKIPMQPGNEGAVEVSHEEIAKNSRKLPSAAAAMAAAATPPQQEVVAHVQQQHQQQPAMVPPAPVPTLPNEYQHQQYQQQQAKAVPSHQMTYAERQALAAQRQQSSMGGAAGVQYVQGPNGLIPVQTVAMANPDVYGAPVVVQQPLQPVSPYGYAPMPGYQPATAYPNTQFVQPAFNGMGF